jgi:hypothetical protein
MFLAAPAAGAIWLRRFANDPLRARPALLSFRVVDGAGDQ